MKTPCPALFADVTPAQESALQSLLHATAGAGVALVPLILAAAYLAVATGVRAAALRRRALMPPELVKILDHAAVGVRPAPADLEAVCRTLDGRAPLVRAARAAAGMAGRDYATVRAAVDHVLGIEAALLRRKNGAFDAVYAVSTLLGLLGSAGGLIVAFRRASGAEPAGPELNATIASALAATGLSIVLAVAAKVVAEAFRQRVIALTAEVASLTEPLVRLYAGHAPAGGRVLTPEAASELP